MASVVASFELTTMIGAVASIRAADPPRAGAEHPAAEAPGEQAGARAGEGRDEPGAEGVVAADGQAGAHQPVDQDRLVIAGLAVEGRVEPVAPGPHLAGAAGVTGLVAIPEARAAVARRG